MGWWRSVTGNERDRQAQPATLRRGRGQRVVAMAVAGVTVLALSGRISRLSFAMKLLLLLTLACTFTCGTRAADEPLALLDLEGKRHTPLVAADAKPVVLVFISPYCPTANAYLPEINRIAALYRGRAAFYLVQSDASVKKADAVKQVELFEIRTPVLLDPAQHLARLAKARVTPEVVVFHGAGTPLYQGRIDDLYINQTRKRPEPTTRDLVAALDAILAGKPVAVPLTKAMGCSIPEMN